VNPSNHNISGSIHPLDDGTQSFLDEMNKLRDEEENDVADENLNIYDETDESLQYDEIYPYGEDEVTES